MDMYSVTNGGFDKVSFSVASRGEPGPCVVSPRSLSPTPSGWALEHSAYVRAGAPDSDDGDSVHGGSDCSQSSHRSGHGAFQLLHGFSSVLRNAYDEDVVRVMAGNTAALRVYFEKAESLAVKTLDAMVEGLKTSGVRISDDVLCLRDLSVSLNTDAIPSDRPEVFEYPSGFCYLGFSRDAYVRRHMTALREWPEILCVLNLRLDQFDLAALVNTSLVVDLVAQRVHVVQGGGVHSTLAYLVGAARSYVGSSDGGFQNDSLGQYLLTLTEVKPVSGSGVDVLMRIGGDVGLTGPQDAVVDDLISNCELVDVDRSRLWEAVQLAGNGVTEIAGRPIVTGNKVLAMLGDSLLKSALVARGMHLRIGDVQVAVSDVLSNSCLATAAKMWFVGPLLQGSVGGGRPSDYVLATAMEAIAGACYYGGGMDSVTRFLERITVFTGRAFRYPWLVPDPSGVR